MSEVLRCVGEAAVIQHSAITESPPMGRNCTCSAGAKGVTYERGK